MNFLYPFVVAYQKLKCYNLSIWQVIDEFNQHVHLVEIDIEEDPEIAEAAGIMGTPCVQFFKNKEMIRLVKIWSLKYGIFCPNHQHLNSFLYTTRCIRLKYSIFLMSLLVAQGKRAPYLLSDIVKMLSLM